MESLAAVKTEENIALVQKAYADFATGNVQGVADACSEDVAWGSYENPTVPYAGNFKGRKGVLEFFGRIAANIDYRDFQTKEFYASGNKIFVKGYHSANVKSTGKTFGHEFLMEFQVDEGKISSFFAFVDSRDQTNAFAGN